MRAQKHKHLAIVFGCSTSTKRSYLYDYLKGMMFNEAHADTKETFK